MTVYSPLVCYCDGSIDYSTNYGVGATVIYDTHGFMYYQNTVGMVQCTTNLAEYAGLLLALEYLIENGLTDRQVNLFTDSALIVGQVNGVFKCNYNHLRKLRDVAIDSFALFTIPPTLAWLPREENRVADQLSKLPHKFKEKKAAYYAIRETQWDKFEQSNEGLIKRPVFKSNPDVRYDYLYFNYNT